MTLKYETRLAAEARKLMRTNSVTLREISEELKIGISTLRDKLNKATLTDREYEVVAKNLRVKPEYLKELASKSSLKATDALSTLLEHGINNNVLINALLPFIGELVAAKRNSEKKIHTPPFTKEDIIKEIKDAVGKILEELKN